VIVLNDVGALKAGLELESQPTFNPPDVVLIKEIWR
jgi:hypothetical protein